MDLRRPTLEGEGLIMTFPIMAVLSGDIVKSTKMTAKQLDFVRDVLEVAVGEARNWSGATMHGPDFYRGDAWQLVVEDPRWFLRLAVWMKTALAVSPFKAQTRIAIGVGEVEALDPDVVSRSIGDAFTLSGRALDAMGKRRDMVLALPEEQVGLSWLAAQVGVCDYIVSRWTRSQAEVALPLLVPNAPSQAEAAEALGRLPQAVSRVYRDAGLYVLLEVLETVEGAAFSDLRGKASG